MHNKIMRFNLFVNLMNPDPRGLYVRYEDHMAAMEAVKPSQCLHQIQEPPTKTEALAHYSQQAILAMGEAGAAQHVAADVPASGAVALTEYLKDCDQHSIVPDVGGAFASAFKAGFNLAASPAQATQPEVVEALRALHDSLELALKLGHLSERALEIIIMQPATDVPMRSSTLAQVDAAVAAPLPLLVRDIARELCISSVEACNALKPLGNYSTNTAVTAEMMAKLRECFPERVPASEVGGARERMTAGRACYFMERFLKEEKLLGPNEQAALHYVIDMLEAAAAPVVLPAGWVPCIVTHEGQHPEEVAYGPQVMMDRLKKWLWRYFELKAAAPVVQPDFAAWWTKAGDGRSKMLAKRAWEAALLAGVSAPAAQAVASIYVTADGQRECDDWKVPLPIGSNLLYTAPQAQADARDAAPAASEQDALQQVRQTVRDFHYALDSRTHGGVAAGAAMNAIEMALNMYWHQGQEADRRAAIAAQAAQAAQQGGAA